MTKQQALENHRKMWNWIADETLRQGRKVEKVEYFRAKKIPIDDRPVSYCYCCEYAMDSNCKLCPVVWVDENGMKNKDNCIALSAYFTKWVYTFDYEEAAKYARKIAELPERE